MANQQVDPVRTSVGTDQLVPAFVAAWKKLVGTDPTKEQIAMLLSQNALETGGFTTTAMFNYNIGNIVKTTQDDYDYFVHPDSYHGKKFMSKFRAYNTLTDGVYDYLRLLKNGYPQAFQATTATPTDFAHALVSNPKFQYYDATHEKEYASGMTSLYNKIMSSKNYDALFNQNATSTPSQQPDDMVSQLENLMSKFLSAISSNQHQQLLHKKAQYLQLPRHQFLIRLNGQNVSDTIEFARVLSSALKEELLAETQIHHQGSNIEIQCQVSGAQDLCCKSVIQLCDALSNVFTEATQCLGGIIITADIFPSIHSNYQELGIKVAQASYHTFHSKITKAHNGN